jgi:hypothetical protein
MKTTPSRFGKLQGNALLLTVFITGLIGFVLAVYLTMVQNQNSANTRSQVWNSAMPVVEAGIEDALAHLNRHGTTNLLCDGWTLSGATYSVTRTVGEGTYSARISNFAAGTNTSPVIESFGYVVAPTLMASAANGALLAAGGETSPSIFHIGRGVRVQTRQDMIFTKGMVAKDTIDLNGNNITANSFDSMDPAYSTNGKYDPNKFKDNGDVAVNSSLTNSLLTGNANIYGHVSTGPGGTVSIGPSGAVGSTNWHNSGADGIESGWSKDDMNVSFPDVLPPWTGGAFTPSGGWMTNVVTAFSTNSSTFGPMITFPAISGVTITTNYQTSVGAVYPIGSPGPVTTNRFSNGIIKSYTYPVFTYVDNTVATNETVTMTYYDVLITDPGNYELANLNGSIYVSANATLYVTTTLSISTLVIAPPNGKLTLYSKAPSVTLAGNNTANSAGNAYAFSFWGLPECTSLTFSGNAGFTGTIYAPNADFTLNAGGNNVIDFIGASITKTARMNGHFNFHYDEALRIIGPFRGFIVSSWLEMLPSSVPAYDAIGYVSQ